MMACRRSSIGVFKSLVLCDTSSRIPPELAGGTAHQDRPQQGMAPLVEPTLKRWFTEPFLAKRNSVVSASRLIRNTPPRGTRAAAMPSRRST
jgi:hypothetical protein